MSDKTNNVNKGREMRRNVIHLRKDTRSILTELMLPTREQWIKKAEERKGKDWALVEIASQAKKLVSGEVLKTSEQKCI